MLHEHDYINMDMTYREMTNSKKYACDMHVTCTTQLHYWSVRATHGGTNKCEIVLCRTRVGHQYFNFMFFSEYISCPCVVLACPVRATWVFGYIKIMGPITLWSNQNFLSWRVWSYRSRGWVITC